MTVDPLGITHRGLLRNFRSRRIPSEHIHRITLHTGRGPTSCIVDSALGTLRLSVALRDHQADVSLDDALLRTMPDKLAPEVRKLAKR